MLLSNVIFSFCATLLFTFVDSSFINVYPRAEALYLRPDEDAGEPLFLTPLIEQGKIEEARMKATVQHKELDDINSYAGYFTVNKEYNSNMFFWFFPAVHNPKDAPVVLWLQGGPGATSLFGLLMEHGPFEVSVNNTLEMRKYSWHKTHNMIYIDNPVGTGYSFTENEKGYATNETEVGRDLHTALVQFFDLFPELQKNDFYATGESYGGKYVPGISHAIKDFNMKAKIKINLKGLAIGNGLTDPENQLLYGDYLYQVGLVDLNGRNLFHKYEQQTRDLIKQQKFVDAYNLWKEFTSTEHPSLFQNLTGYQIYYNILRSRAYNDSIRAYEWVSRVDVRRAIHVGNCTFEPNNEKVEACLSNDIMQSLAILITDLTQHYRVLLYNGNLDIVVAYTYTENYLQNLKWAGAQKYKKAERKKWWVDGELAGYTKSADTLTEVLVLSAGHLVPMDQPKWTFDLISRFTHNKSF